MVTIFIHRQVCAINKCRDRVIPSLTDCYMLSPALASLKHLPQNNFAVSKKIYKLIYPYYYYVNYTVNINYSVGMILL